MDQALGMIEEHAAFTRTGAGGVAQIATRGLVAVSFTHYDTRDGDPNLHEHVVVSNKIQGVDGVWRALDARGLHAMKVAASDRYNTELTTRVRRLDRRRRDREAHPGRAGNPCGRSPGSRPG